MLEFHEIEEPKPFTVAEQEAIDDLKLMCCDHAHINIQTDDYFLTKFLRFCDWSVQAAYEAILKNYELRRNHPRVFASKQLTDYTHLLSLHSRIILDKRDKNGRAVFIGKLAVMGTTFDFNDASCIDDAWMEVLLSDPLNQMNGLTVIADCKGLSSAILKWLVPKNCTLGAARLEALPVKDWTIHVVNMGPIMRACVMIIKPFLRKSTIARFVFHSNGYKELHEMLGADCLPSEYDGNDGPIDYDKSMKFILGREKIYARNRQFGYKS